MNYPESNIRYLEEIPHIYRSVFQEYPCFNTVQSSVLDDALQTDNSLVVSAPTGSGKTAIFEMAIVRLLMLSEHTGSMPDMKMIYISPIKALCRERLIDWHKKFANFNIKCISLTSDTDDIDVRNISYYNLIISTPEKWDVITRRWRDNPKLVESINLFMIDEVHLLNADLRGSTLEVIVSRMKTAEGFLMLNSKRPKIRFIALSATIPNIEDIAEWIDPTKNVKYFRFSENVRPVKLDKIVYGFNINIKSAFKFELSLNYKLPNLIYKYSQGKPTLIFCSTRKSVEMTTNHLVTNLQIRLSQEQKEVLMQIAHQINDAKLKQFISHGIALHHAGLVHENRNIIETSFREGHLPILVTTSTLAMGVNLPAHLVIVKGTKRYDPNEGFKDYDEVSIFQMIGRAGRSQFDNSATALILTSNQDKIKYEQMLNCTQKIESNLHKHLTEHLNAEIVLKTITDLEVAMNWLSSTFLYVRAKKCPEKYKLPAGLTKEKIDKKLLEMCQIDLNKLVRAGMIKMNQEIEVAPTVVGEIMAKYYIDFNTMELFTKISGNEIMIQILALFSKCHEFSEIHLRTNDKKCLNLLNKNSYKDSIRFPLTGRIKTVDMKINCIIQAVLGNLDISDQSVLNDSVRVMRSCDRLANCLIEYLETRTNCYTALLNTIILAKCFKVKLWENSPYVSKQFTGVGPVISTLLAKAGKSSIKGLIETNPRHIEMIVSRKGPFGSTIVDEALHLPEYQVAMQKFHNDVNLEIHLLNPSTVEEKSTVNLCSKMTLLVGDSNNNILLYEKYAHSYMLDHPKVIRSINIENQECAFITAYLISEDWVGIDCHFKLELLPKPIQAVNQITKPKQNTSKQTFMEMYMQEVKKRITPKKKTISKKKTLACVEIQGDATTEQDKMTNNTLDAKENLINNTHQNRTENDKVKNKENSNTNKEQSRTLNDKVNNIDNCIQNKEQNKRISNTANNKESFVKDTEKKNRSENRKLCNEENLIYNDSVICESKNNDITKMSLCNGLNNPNCSTLPTDYNYLTPKDTELQAMTYSEEKVQEPRKKPANYRNKKILMSRSIFRTKSKLKSSKKLEKSLKSQDFEHKEKNGQYNTTSKEGVFKKRESSPMQTCEIHKNLKRDKFLENVQNPVADNNKNKMYQKFIGSQDNVPKKHFSDKSQVNIFAKNNNFDIGASIMRKSNPTNMRADSEEFFPCESQMNAVMDDFERNENILKNDKLETSKEGSESSDDTDIFNKFKNFSDKKKNTISKIFPSNNDINRTCDSYVSNQYGPTSRDFRKTNKNDSSMHASKELFQLGSQSKLDSNRKNMEQETAKMENVSNSLHTLFKCPDDITDNTDHGINNSKQEIGDSKLCAALYRKYNSKKQFSNQSSSQNNREEYNNHDEKKKNFKEKRNTEKKVSMDYPGPTIKRGQYQTNFLTPISKRCREVDDNAFPFEDSQAKRIKWRSPLVQSPSENLSSQTKTRNTYCFNFDDAGSSSKEDTKEINDLRFGTQDTSSSSNNLNVSGNSQRPSSLASSSAATKKKPIFPLCDQDYVSKNDSFDQNIKHLTDVCDLEFFGLVNKKTSLRKDSTKKSSLPKSSAGEYYNHLINSQHKDLREIEINEKPEEKILLAPYDRASESIRTSSQQLQESPFASDPYPMIQSSQMYHNPKAFQTQIYSQNVPQQCCKQNYNVKGYNPQVPDESQPNTFYYNSEKNVNNFDDINNAHQEVRMQRFPATDDSNHHKFVNVGQKSHEELSQRRHDNYCSLEDGRYRMQPSPYFSYQHPFQDEIMYRQELLAPYSVSSRYPPSMGLRYPFPRYVGVNSYIQEPSPGFGFQSNYPLEHVNNIPSTAIPIYQPQIGRISETYDDQYTQHLQQLDVKPSQAKNNTDEIRSVNPNKPASEQHERNMSYIENRNSHSSDLFFQHNRHEQENRDHHLCQNNENTFNFGPTYSRSDAVKNQTQSNNSFKHLNSKGVQNRQQLLGLSKNNISQFFSPIPKQQLQHSPNLNISHNQKPSLPKTPHQNLLMPSSSQRRLLNLNSFEEGLNNVILPRNRGFTVSTSREQQYDPRIYPSSTSYQPNDKEFVFNRFLFSNGRN